MNYEKKYKEALERARALNDGKDVDVKGGTTICEYIFPELKEREDEKIKKALIEYIKGIKSWNYFLGISKEQMITWLEKQGEQKPTHTTTIHIGEGLLTQVNEVHEYPPTTKEDIRKALMSISTEEYEAIWKETFGETYKEFVDKLLEI